MDKQRVRTKSKPPLTEKLPARGYNQNPQAIVTIFPCAHSASAAARSSATDCETNHYPL